MIDIKKLREDKPRIVAIGNHIPIIQSMLDFDYLSGREEPSVLGIVTRGRRFQKLFWGNGEVLVPCFEDFSDMKRATKEAINFFFNTTSARQVLRTTTEFFYAYPNAYGGHIFAENVPEKIALEIYDKYQDKKFVIGPAGVGILIPGALKLGAIGGTDYRQLVASRVFSPGNIAVLSASGGMTNELIRMVAKSGRRVSFALAFGGDRFPVTTPREAFLAAEKDIETKAIVYFGELGGHDEYEVAGLVKSKKVKKPVLAYIAGTVGEEGDAPMQFGHAKALAGSKEETASAKREALAGAGVRVAGSIGELAKFMKSLKLGTLPKDVIVKKRDLEKRHKSLFTSSISGESADGYRFAGRTLDDWAEHASIAEMVAAGIMGKKPRSKKTAELVDVSLKLLLDHGPQVSGAVNTIVSARAGKDVASAVASGLLTVGPRFGGAGDEAAGNWFAAVSKKTDSRAFIDDFNKRGVYIAGIGHKKYRVGFPDPRVEVLSKFARTLTKHPHLDFARAVEKITTTKRGNLILNADGILAALVLDVLETEEKMKKGEIKMHIDAGIVNGLFVSARTIGLVSHYLDQRRNDEGLFRLPDDLMHGAP